MEMNDIERWAMVICTERVTVDRCLCQGPVWIYHLAMASDSSGAATASIYNGVSAKGNLKIDMTSIDDYFAQHDYWPPMYFDRGLFVVLEDKVKSVIVRYHTHKP